MKTIFTYRFIMAIKSWVVNDFFNFYDELKVEKKIIIIIRFL